MTEKTATKLNVIEAISIAEYFHKRADDFYAAHLSGGDAFRAAAERIDEVLLAMFGGEMDVVISCDSHTEESGADA